MPHRKRIKHYHDPGDLHELTFSCYRQLPLLDDDDLKRDLARSVDAAGEAERIALVAFVFMPDHVHLVVDPQTREPRIDRYLALIKRPVSAAAKRNMLQRDGSLPDALLVDDRPGKVCFRFWQEGPGYDRNLNSPAAILAAIDYLHANPVRRGLYDRGRDWKWSSARWYESDGSHRDPDLPVLTGLRHGTLDLGQ